MRIRWVDITGKPLWLTYQDPGYAKLTPDQLAAIGRVESLTGSGFVRREASGALVTVDLPEPDAPGIPIPETRGLVAWTQDGVRTRELVMPATLFDVANPGGAYGDPTTSLKQQIANTVFASPDGSAGEPTFRLLAVDDIPDLSSLYDVAGSAAAALVSANSYTDAEIGGLSSVYQPLDGDLTAIAALAGTGWARKTGVDAWTLDTELPADAVILSPGESVQDWQAWTQGGGRHEGGNVTPNGDGTVAITAGSGLNRPNPASPSSCPCTGDDAIIEPMNHVEWEAVPALALTDNAYNFIFYDGSAGVIAATTDYYSIDFAQDFTIGRAYRTGTEVVARLCGTNLWNFTRRVQLFGEETFPVLRARGMATSATGTRNIAITAGILWAELVNRFTTDAFDSSGADRFSTWYRDGIGGWTRTTGQAQVNNLNYDNNSGTLAVLTNNRYAVHWVYVAHDSSVHLIYGQGDYLLPAAEASTPPETLPGLVAAYATLVARIIVQKSSSSLAIQTAFTTTFATSGVTNHNDLAGLQGGIAGEYFHLTSAQHGWLPTAALGTAAYQDSTAFAPAGSGVTSIAGTANQVAASAATGAVTLSLPTQLYLENFSPSPTLRLSGQSGFGGGPELMLRASNGGGSISIGDSLGRVEFFQHNGTDFVRGARMQAVAQTTNSAALIFQTYTSGLVTASMNLFPTGELQGMSGIGIGVSATNALNIKARSGQSIVASLEGSGIGADNNTQIWFRGKTAATGLWAIGTDIAAASGSRDFSLYDFQFGDRFRIESSTGPGSNAYLNARLVLGRNDSVSEGAEIGFSDFTNIVRGGIDHYSSAGLDQMRYFSSGRAAYRGEHVFLTRDNDGGFIVPFTVSSLGALLGQQTALATTATEGFAYVPTCPGAPTGTAASVTGLAPIVIDTANHALNFYSGGAWRSGGGGRDVLTANRTYYVSTAGSDANNGLTVGSPFLTIQHALDVVSLLDIAGFTVTIQLANGTYAEALNLAAPVGSGVVDILGDTTTPANVTVNATGDAFRGTSVASGPVTWQVRGVRMVATGSAISSQFGAAFVVANVEFGACGGQHMLATFSGRINVNGNYAIIGGAQHHLFVTQGGILQINNSLTVTLTGTPAFSTAFASSTIVAVIRARSLTFSGGATGIRYIASMNGAIDVGGAGATYLPGNVAGTTATGGQYA